MRRMFAYLMEIKTRACLIFTGSVLAYALIYGVLVEWRISSAIIFQLGLVSVLCAAVQFIFFSQMVFRKMSYGRRVVCALPAFLAPIALLAVLFGWFPVEQWRSWLIFLGIFLLMFGGTMAGFELYFRASGRKYDDLLADWQKWSKEAER